jgi:hypothetical protein
MPIERLQLKIVQPEEDGIAPFHNSKDNRLFNTQDL